MDDQTSWLRSLADDELTHTWDDCRIRAKRHRQHGRFGLSWWWTYLARDVMDEIARRENIERELMNLTPVQLSLSDDGSDDRPLDSGLLLPAPWERGSARR